MSLSASTPLRATLMRPARIFQPAPEVLAQLNTPLEARETVAAAAGGAPFLGRCLVKEATWLEGAWERPAEQSLRELIAEVERAEQEGEAEAMRIYRVARRRAALLIALADLGGDWSLDEVTNALTRFSDALTRSALNRALAEERARGELQWITPERSGFVALAMGKMGAFELNYSSDIDLILLFDETCMQQSARLYGKDRFAKAARKIVKLLSEVTSDGYAARVDLRLRPDPSATPPCLSMTAAEHYYEALGRTWERAAHIKARPAAGDIAAGEAYLQRLRPFVWRRYIDFAAMEDAADMLARIRAHKGGGRIEVAGQDVKLGAGGIREIEFVAQTWQLILGGREEHLRSPSTRQTLGALVEVGRMSPDDRAALDAAYVYLRNLEHRLQMIEDQQTHQMPKSAEGLERVAALMGESSAESLIESTRAHMERVRKVAGPDLDGRKAPEPNALIEAAETLPDPQRAQSLAQGWLTGRVLAVRSERARAALERLSPSILKAMAGAPDPMQALAQFDSFLRNLPAGAQLLALFEANPKLLELLTHICGTAPRLAQNLARRSSTLDAVLDQNFFAPTPPLAELQSELAEVLRRQVDYERRLDAVRRWSAERRFQVGVSVLQGLTPSAQAGAAYSDIAEAVLTEVYPYVQADFEARHGAAPGRGAAVLAMGRLGSREMTVGSDLDLIVVYDADASETSNGPRNLEAPAYFTRFTQSLISALTVTTSAGALYEVDMRLRPSGRAGPLATSLKAFNRYQRESAWVWEHMALTRGRVVAGEPELAKDVRAVIREALLGARPTDEIRAAALEMRAKLDAAHPKARAQPWDFKFAPGGLVDIEFIAQTEALIHHLANNGGLSAADALHRMRAAGALADADYEALLEAEALQSGLRRLAHVALEGEFNPENAGVALKQAMARAAGCESFEAVERRLIQAQMQARAVFIQRIGALEGESP